MKKLFIPPLPYLLLSLCVSQSQAQVQVRPEDHFYRQRVVNRIDLGEKINQALVYRAGAEFSTNDPQAYQGIVSALLQGLKQGKYLAYHPDELSKPMDYGSVLMRMQDFDFIPGSADSLDEAEMVTEPDLGFEEIDFYNDLGPSSVSAPDPFDDLGAYEQVIQFVEDRIFDKARSEMRYDLDFIQIIWSDPGETLPDKYLACFRFRDVLPVLDQVYAYNRFNDAEQRTIREIFELRLFHSYIINVSGRGVQSLPEAEWRRQELIAYEHHLWHY